MTVTPESVSSSTNCHAIPPDERTWLIDADEYGFIAIDGADAVKFLQGQVTCDVLELAAATTRLGAQCTPKGRMLFSFRALQPSPTRVLLRMHSGLVDTALTSLGKYIVFSKAKLANVNEDYQSIIIRGPNAAAIVERNFGAVPANNDDWIEFNGCLVIKISCDIFECWLTADHAEPIRAALTTECVKVGSNAASLLAIRHGLGEVRSETQETFTPQALNFQLVNAINFRKGCYTGQEIVARLHYRGTLKRHMYRFGFVLVDGENLPAPGSAVVNTSQQNIGEIVLAAHAENGHAEALAVVADDQLTQVRLPGEGGKILMPLPLPYAIPSEDKN
jgi:folate-binding protein YgfZ